MSRPVNGYRLADGTKVPGVTTILGRYKESGGLIHWAWQQGRDGKDYREKSEEAAGIGHEVHRLIEQSIKDPGTRHTMGEEAGKAFGAFVEWRLQTRMEVLETEVPLVSQQHRYGGTVDAIGTVLDDLVLIDWKSSNRIYSEYLLQIAAYRALWEECRGTKISGAHLLRVGKEFGDFHHSSWPIPVIDMAWRGFVLMRELYDLDKPLKAAVGA